MSKNSSEAKPEYVPPPPLVKIGDSKGNKK